MGFTFVEWDGPNEPPEGFENFVYEQRCENEFDESGNPLDEPCNGKVWSTGGHPYYNGSYQCYTIYLFCENCGHYEVECV